MYTYAYIYIHTYIHTYIYKYALIYVLSLTNGQTYTAGSKRKDNVSGAGMQPKKMQKRKEKEKRITDQICQNKYVRCRYATQKNAKRKKKKDKG